MEVFFNGGAGAKVGSSLVSFLRGAGAKTDSSKPLICASVAGVCCGSLPKKASQIWPYGKLGNSKQLSKEDCKLRQSCTLMKLISAGPTGPRTTSVTAKKTKSHAERLCRAAFIKLQKPCSSSARTNKGNPIWDTLVAPRVLRACGNIMLGRRFLDIQL